MIKIDKTSPTCTITRNKANPDGLNDWYKTKVTLTLSTTNPKGTSDRAVASPISYDLKNKNKASYNGITTNTQSDTAGITWYGFVKDEAGNTNTCNSGKFKVDTTKPDKPKITNPYENKWTNKSYSISIVSVDKTAGIDYFAYRYPSSTSPGENAWAKYNNSSRTPGVNTAFTTTNFSKERDENVEIKVCDVAGNCSGTSLSRIRIDKTAPTCTVTKNIAKPNGNNGWYKTKVTLTLSTTNPKGSSDRAVASGISYDLKNKNKASYNGVTKKTQKETKGITWYGFVKDEAGNTSTCNSGKFKVDTVGPSISFGISGTNGTTATSTCSDSLSGLSGSSSGSMRLSGKSSVTYTRTCTDKAGNSTTSSHTYSYNSCKSKECVGGQYCSDCYTGDPNTCVGGYVNTTCKRYNISRRKCPVSVGGNITTPAVCDSACYSTGGDNYICDVIGSCAEYNTSYDSCKKTENTCAPGCDPWDDCYTKECVGGFDF